MTNRLTVKVNYILDAQNNGKLNFDIFNYKIFKNQTINTKDMRKKYKNSQKPAKRQCDRHLCFS